MSASYAPTSKALLWTGRVLSALPSFAFLMSGAMKVSMSPEVIKGFTDFGFSESVIRPIGIVELSCVALYLFPRTAVLGAILATAYMGGAVATHVHAGQPLYAPIIVGMLFWAGLGLRDTRVMALVPIRSV